MLESGAHSLWSLAFHIATIGVEFEVIEPPELTTLIEEIGGRLVRAAERSRSWLGSRLEPVGPVMWY